MNQTDTADLVSMYCILSHYLIDLLDRKRTKIWHFLDHSWINSGSVVQMGRCVSLCKTQLHPVSVPVGLSGRQPGNYTALTTSQDRKTHYHKHAQKHSFASTEYTDQTNPTSIRNIFSHSVSSTHTHTHRVYYVKEDYNDSNLTWLCSCSAPGASVLEFTGWGKRLSTV